MTMPPNHPPAKSVPTILARDTIAELALDLAATAEILADHAPRATLPTLEKAIHALRAAVLMIGQTFREAEAAEKQEAA
jgi:hypothetical protein